MKTEIVDIEEIKELIFAYATGDYTRRAELSDNLDERDSILGIINMLGEELEETTVSRDYFSSIYNAVAEMLFLISPAGIIDDCNEAVNKELGYAGSDLIGSSIKQIIVGEYDLESKIKAHIREYDGHFTDELRFLQKDASGMPVSVTVSRIPDDPHDRLLVMAKNITEQKKTEQLILTTIIDTEERERKRLAFDLHDSLGQEINAVKMYLNVAGYGDIDEKTRQNIEQCKSMLEGSLDSIRKIVFDLLPASLDKGNLILALEQLLDGLEGLNGTQFQLKVSGEVRDVPKRVELMIYRIVQEFVSNTIKYAEAENVLAQLIFEPTQLRVELEDDGKGFETGTILGGGNGLKNMVSRARAVDGDLSIDSKVGKGTRLSATFKVN